MERKEFIKGLGLAGLTVTGLFFSTSCSKDSDYSTSDTETSTDSDTTTDTDGTDSSSSEDCSQTPAETQGPYPTKDPSQYERVNIVGDRTGIGLDIDIIIRNVNDSCNVLEGALVDIWHCDKDGNYSEYGNYSTNHFLRGRQASNADGLVEFTSVFPGWYNGRSTHIHVHVYDVSGNSLLITQIAFPEGDNSAVLRVNAASDKGYTKGMTGYTYNANDNVFSDGVDEELASVSGSVSEGFVLTHDIYVKA